jgi:hypothetical protein
MKRGEKMKIYITANGKTADITNYVERASLSGDYESCVRRLEISILSEKNKKNTQNISYELGNGIIMTENGERIFNGFIFSKDSNTEKSIIDIGCVDRGIFIKRNQGVYSVNTTAESMVKRICTDFGIAAGNIASTGVTIKRKFVGNSLLDIIQTLYSIASQSTGKKYVVRFEDDKLCVVERNEESVATIDGTHNLTYLKASENAENLVNCVAVYGKDQYYINSFKDNESISKFGLLQKYEYKGDDEDAAKLAEKILTENAVERKITVENTGNTKCISGNSVTVKEPYTGLNGLFYIDRDVHIWQRGIYSNSLTLNFKKIMSDKNSGSDLE